MKTAIIVTGVLSALVYIFPGLVIIGMFLLVVPGLILMAMPTVFLYLLATWLIRLVLPIESDLIAYPVAFAGALALASLAVWPLRSTAISEFEEARQTEIFADEPIALSGHVLIEERRGIRAASAPQCDALCLAILDLDEVESVTIVRESMTTSFALITIDPEAEFGPPESETPISPGGIIAIAGQTGDYRVAQRAKESLTREWEARLAGPQRLVKVETFDGKPDWHLLQTWGDLTRIDTITGPDGETKLRRVSVSKLIPAIPPYIGFKSDSALSGFSGRGFVLGGTKRTQETAFESGIPEETFARALALKDYWTAHAPPDQSE